MAAAAAAGNNNDIRLNVVVLVTETRPDNGEEDTVMRHRVFTLPHRPLLKADTAVAVLRDVVEWFSIPMDPSIVEKVVESARHLLLLPGTMLTDLPPEFGEGANNGEPPSTTVRITVDHGVVSVEGDFDKEEEESDSDNDDGDGDGGDGMEVEVKVEEEGVKME
ncbi:unnamed protein product [Linum trigynum]|uniref:Uncharacterized protein n=1 Tax=Linum trigynum TaxID=586398 RepID=A0AAV2EZN9_9ROSI